MSRLTQLATRLYKSLHRGCIGDTPAAQTQLHPGEMALGTFSKEREMKPIRLSLVTAGLLLALGGAAFAQSGPAAGPMAGGMPHGAQSPQVEKMREHQREHKMGHQGERHAKHLAELKTKLKLEASQEGAWKTFADAVQPSATPSARLDRAALAKMTTPERIDQMQAWHAQHDADMKKHAEATKTFYAGLNAEQKKTFDGESGRFMQREMGAGMHRHKREHASH